MRIPALLALLPIAFALSAFQIAPPAERITIARGASVAGILAGAALILTR